MIKQLLLGALSLFMLSPFAHAQQPLADTLLWKIEGNELKAPSFLFGTIHATCKVVISDKMQNALDQVSGLVMEVDINDMSGLTSKDAISSVMIGNGETWQDHLSPEEYQKIKDFFADFDSVNLGTVEMMKPKIISALMIKDLVDCTLDAYEMKLNAYASKSELNIFGLETFTEQMLMLSGEPLESQFEDFIAMTTLDKKEHTAMMADMMRLYDEERLTELYEFITADNVVNNMFDQENLLDKRNQRWIPKLEPLMTQQPVFVAVGAAHLPGKNGVINLLREAGYVLTPITD